MVADARTNLMLAMMLGLAALALVPQAAAAGDWDVDGVPDDVDNCPYAYNPNQADYGPKGGDGEGNVCQDGIPWMDGSMDKDGDGTANTDDPCPFTPYAAGPNCALDYDNDGLADKDEYSAGVPFGEVGTCPEPKGYYDCSSDYCPSGTTCGGGCASSPAGYDCDMDSDGVGNAVDNCPEVANSQQTDANGNGVGDACEGACPAPTACGTPGKSDADADGVMDSSDNCPNVANGGQQDMDKDGSGDACDDDSDNDGVTDALDNCPFYGNKDQADADQDGVGDSCDSNPTNCSTPGQPACNGGTTAASGGSGNYVAPSSSGGTPSQDSSPSSTFTAPQLPAQPAPKAPVLPLTKAASSPGAPAYASGTSTAAQPAADGPVPCTGACDPDSFTVQQAPDTATPWILGGLGFLGAAGVVALFWNLRKA